MFFGGVGWGEEAHGEYAICRDNNTTRGERLARDKAVIRCTEKH
jgi:hypothetical protein